MATRFKPRDQIEYRAGHPGAKPEYGFVTTIRPDPEGENVVFCRFWRPIDHEDGELGGKYVLRTKSTSEACRECDLKLYDYGAEEAIRYICDAFEWGL